MKKKNRKSIFLLYYMIIRKMLIRIYFGVIKLIIDKIKIIYYEQN